MKSIAYANKDLKRRQSFPTLTSLVAEKYQDAKNIKLQIFNIERTL